ncbi:MAG: tRNA uridine-5-carboxymethylaminomethyl(34) synthesis GTPase MnmE [Lentisphaeria bacterium]|nr:tRNA uridine-5-carboxymethylaminomethyl(34) synthesis GTPase MnmE [Lentisphaeria bacterium]
MKKSSDRDTIAALCTAPGGALNILRISGPDALSIGKAVWRGGTELGPASARKMLLGKVCRLPGDPASGEPCLTVFMPGPASYTGEDTVELHCHGGAFAPRRLLAAVLAAGARSAEPGEFTKRAFLNGKMDLTQAEAVADLIAAKSDSAARLAEKQLAGRIGAEIGTFRSTLLRLLSEFESRLDFSEEDLDWESPEKCLAELENTAGAVRRLIRSADRGVILRNGVSVVIAGRPNAGKSSLLNALLGFDRAIVTEIPGTTRDTLEESVSLRDIPVRLTDTAGLREGADDPVERLGIRRSLDSLRDAVCIFWVLDASTPAAAEEAAAHLRKNRPEKTALIALWNKTDLPGSPDVLPDLGDIPAIRISARTGAGLAELLDRFAELVWQNGPDRETSGCEVSARHADLLKTALEMVERAMDEVRQGSWELAAFSLREALNALGSITGETVSPDILDEIFSRFCIGK